MEIARREVVPCWRSAERKFGQRAQLKWQRRVNKNKVKYLMRLMFLILIVLVEFGCNTPHDEWARDTSLEPLPLPGRLYPPLLPLEKKHSVSIRARKKIPESLTEKDVSEIVAIIGRIPGIDYEIRTWHKPRTRLDLAMDPGADPSRAFVVYTSSYVLLLEREEGNWRFRNYWMYSR